MDTSMKLLSFRKHKGTGLMYKQTPESFSRGDRYVEVYVPDERIRIAMALLEAAVDEDGDADLDGVGHLRNYPWAQHTYYHVDPDFKGATHVDSDK